jgi:hypothetical protein
MMNRIYTSITLPLLSMVSAMLLLAPANAETDTAAGNAAAVAKFEQAVNRTENLQLPLNKVVLYRQAAVALMPTDKPQAIMLLKRALSDIDAAERAMKAEGTLDDKTYQLMEFHRLPVIMLMERIDPAEALSVLGPPQTADRDTAFQALFFERLKNPELVNEAALRKLDYGVTPAAVAAYDVLKKSDPGAARTLAAAIVLKLTKADAENDAAAVQSAFGLVRLLRTDIGALAPAMILDPALLGPDSMRDLFSFIGDAFLASKDPETLIVGENPRLYVSALEVYAPIKAQDVKLLDFAAPDAKSLIFSPEKPVIDANHPDPATLTPEQLRDRAAKKAQVDAQMDETNAELKLLIAKVGQPALTQKERDDTVYAIVDQANKAVSLARSAATTLDREAFRDGELELYNLGIVTNVVDSVSAVLQTYAVDHPKVAEEAASNLDGHEVQTEVALQIAIREMTGAPAYLVPPAKRPPEPAHKVAPAPAAAPANGYVLLP